MVDISTETVVTPDGPMQVSSCRPDAGATQAVIVIHEALGVTEYIEGVARSLASVGYHAVAPALFHRAGGGTADLGDFDGVTQLFGGLTDADIVMDVGTTIAHLNDKGFADRAIGMVGFCWGGRVSFLGSLEHRLGAAVGFYGGGIVSRRFPRLPPLLERAGELKTPWLGLFGDLDTVIPTADVEALRERLAAIDVPTEVQRYATAEHGFHNESRPSYNAAAASDAWQRTLAWLMTHLS